MPGCNKLYLPGAAEPFIDLKFAPLAMYSMVTWPLCGLWPRMRGMTACDAVHMVLDQQETVRHVEEQLKVQRKLPAAREQRGSGESIEGKELVAAGACRQGQQYQH